MARRQAQLADLELRRVHRAKQQRVPVTASLGPELLGFFKQSVEKRQTKFTKIAEYWVRLVPEQLQEHSALESFNAGTLKIIVDSSSHLYDLKRLLLAGLQKQLLLACKSTGLRKISVKLGRWYEGDGNDRRIRF